MITDRETFIKMVGIIICIFISTGVVAQESVFEPLKIVSKTKTLSIDSGPVNYLIEQLRPRQIMNVVSKSSVVFIPVSPVFEGHSHHLPLATFIKLNSILI